MALYSSAFFNILNLAVGRRPAIAQTLPLRPSHPFRGLSIDTVEVVEVVSKS